MYMCTLAYDINHLKGSIMEYQKLKKVIFKTLEIYKYGNFAKN